jgi:hypothetical protein
LAAGAAAVNPRECRINAYLGATLPAAISSAISMDRPVGSAV